MADLPKGVVTFLFTDIEGSTRLVKQLRERWGDVVGEHQQSPGRLPPTPELPAYAWVGGEHEARTRTNGKDAFA